MKFRVFSAAEFFCEKTWERYGEILEEMAQGYYDEEEDLIYATFDSLDHLLRVADALGSDLMLDTLREHKSIWIKNGYME